MELSANYSCTPVVNGMTPSNELAITTVPNHFLDVNPSGKAIGDCTSNWGPLRRCCFANQGLAHT